MKKVLAYGAALQLLFLVGCNSGPKPKEAEVAPTATEDRDPSVRAQDYETGAADNRADTMAPQVDSSAAAATTGP
ncbi:hypothetical protein [Rufibacter psychrotolerans]|uniref:hypothetical protein n=1 Tax=Rufibacter psychrotolerans TaxID=2812556 RepID=UPI0019674983|nr:hypothetical protein [Rufibacter sp. SYSU D00308]